MKKLNFIILLISLFLLNCTKKEEVKNEVYIISKEERENKKRREEGRLVPPPPPVFYGSSNIIIDKKGDLYFYQKTYYVLWNCIPEKNPLPEFINLQPKDLVKLPINSVQAFLKENILKKINDKRGLLIVASQLDTLKNEGFFNITHFLNDNKITLYLIRRTTQEEDVVLEYKESDLFYNSDSVQWNKSRIKFFDSK